MNKKTIEKKIFIGETLLSFINDKNLINTKYLKSLKTQLKNIEKQEDIEFNERMDRPRSNPTPNDGRSYLDDENDFYYS